MADAKNTDARNTDGNRQIEPDAIRPPPHYREGRRQVLTADTARQGPGGYRVLMVLAISIVAAFVVWAIGYWLGWF